MAFSGAVMGGVAAGRKMTGSSYRRSTALPSTASSANINEDERTAGYTDGELAAIVGPGDGDTHSLPGQPPDPQRHGRYSVDNGEMTRMHDPNRLAPFDYNPPDRRGGSRLSTVSSVDGQEQGLNVDVYPPTPRDGFFNDDVFNTSPREKK